MIYAHTGCECYGEPHATVAGSGSQPRPWGVSCAVVRIHFPFNSVEVAPSERPLLERSARCLRADRTLRVTIEGNADERGTEEYNMALGDRRARITRDQLQRLGVGRRDMTTHSVGEEHATGADEYGWSRDRRSEMTPR